MMPFYWMWDSTYILVIIGMILSLVASSFVKSTFQKYSSVDNSKGLTGDDVARLILENANINDVSVQRIGGSLTDNYNPRNKTLNLSEVVGPSTSVASIGVAAHECGHAVQDDLNYFPLRLRNALAPVVNFGSSISFPLILFGIFTSQIWIQLGILCFSLVLLFQVVTLPVEFNASRRAIAILREGQTLTEDELTIVRKVLTAAALTYVASAIATFLQLFRLILLFGNRRD